jgi:hypothetical protein
MTDTLLPASISKHLSTIPSPRIADVATGTAVWLNAVSKTLPPTAQLDGYDFDTSKFPPASALPANVNLSFGNVLEPFPAELLGTYDLVHVRLLMYGLQSHEWEIAARNLAALVKPEGYLLWEETGYTSWVTLPPSKAWYELLDYDIRFAMESGRDVT